MKKKYCDVYKTKNALTDHQLKAFCSKNNISYHYCDLKNLSSDISKLPATCFVFTGNSKDDFNNGYDQHWLFLFGNQLFDSYSFQNKYKLDPSIKAVKLFPKQLQEYNAVVCGEYCLAFADFIDKEDFKEDEVGFDFCNYHGFTKNKHKNDETIFNWYEEKKD